MPRVKIDYVVSFSSEDPDNPASNLLASEVSKKKWLCAKGEPSCSVVLQLAKAVQISAVQIGGYNTALVEVLVGRSENPNEPFQVLVPSCVFLSPAESRRECAAERVRSFSGDQLAAARTQRWDRLRLVCSQPYNKHVQYGLSFIHIHSPEESEHTTLGDTSDVRTEAGAVTPATSVPARLSMAVADAGSSDDDDFRPGELFAKHRQLPQASTSADTGAQIRQATSQALKKISDSATKLVKTPISRNGSGRRDGSADRCGDRRRDTLLYDDDDDTPHARIDRVVQRHNDEKTRAELDNKPNRGERREDRIESSRKKTEKESRHGSDNRKDQTSSRSDKRKDRSDGPGGSDPDINKRARPSTSAASESDETKEKKRPRDRSPRKGGDRDLQTVLAGVVLTLSGYVHPRRGQLRDRALTMGARCERDWGPACTHLVCAFPNTPKLKQVRSSPGGASVPVVRGEWLERCFWRRRRLPWRWFATEDKDREDPPDNDGESDDDDHQREGDDETEGDTDDEIEKALRKQKKRKTEGSPDAAPAPALTPAPAPAPAPSPAPAGPADGSRARGSVTVADSDDEPTDEDVANGENEANSGEEAIDACKSLPELFEGRTFVVSTGAGDHWRRALQRYVRAYGGLCLHESELEPDSSVDYYLCFQRPAKLPAGARALRPDWVWACHESAQLVSTDRYQL